MERDDDAGRFDPTTRRERRGRLARVGHPGDRERNDENDRNLQRRAPNSVSPFFQAMRSATSAGRSLSHARENAAFSGT